ncbi:MAG: hypothetical protein IJ573_07645, partial [Clostridia bacterium]|nr:hypothetical protein [Clostridia bacterium]
DQQVEEHQHLCAGHSGKDGHAYASGFKYQTPPIVMKKLRLFKGGARYKRRQESSSCAIFP